MVYWAHQQYQQQYLVELPEHFSSKEDLENTQLKAEVKHPFLFLF
jgi:hypothetical protein